jgi:hypothetical protein
MKYLILFIFVCIGCTPSSQTPNTSKAPDSYEHITSIRIINTNNNTTNIIRISPNISPVVKAAVIHDVMTYLGYQDGCVFFVSPDSWIQGFDATNGNIVKQTTYRDFTNTITNLYK